MTYYLYARCSTDTELQEESIPLQQHRLLTAVEGSLAEKLTGHSFGGFYPDKGVSASIPLMKRPAGLRMLHQLKPGDIIITQDQSRMFRSMGDCMAMMQWFEQNEIKILLLVGYLDTTTSEGRMIAAMLSYAHEVERTAASQRQRGSRLAREQMGIPAGGVCVGWKPIKRWNGQKHVAAQAPDMAARQEIIDLKALADKLKLTPERLEPVLRMNNISRKTGKMRGKRWNASTIRTAFLALKNDWPQVSPDREPARLRRERMAKRMANTIRLPPLSTLDDM